MIVTSPPYLGHLKRFGDTTLGTEKCPFLWARNVANIFGQAQDAFYLSEDRVLVMTIGDCRSQADFFDPLERFPMIQKGGLVGCHFW